ncbi:MAG: thioredoxin family protein [Candidatus Eremiobacteraeota bacterium]|nr:thioredoxin family protein [Candidatus Eremiobacteraeota bacterium]
MRKFLRLTCFLLLCSGLASAETWLTSWDQAAAESKKSGKPILMDFTGSDWCIWCQRLKGEVFETPEFKAWAAKNVVLLELDYPRSTPQAEAVKKQNAELAKKYSIQGYPTVLFVDATGTVLGKSGYAKGGPAGWTENATRLIQKK